MSSPTPLTEDYRAPDAQGADYETAETALAATTIYNGATLARNSAGTVQPATNAASLKLAGIAASPVSPTSTAFAGPGLTAWQRGRFVRDWADGSAAIALLGRPCYVYDDHSVTASANHSLLCGTIVEIISADKVRVDILSGMLNTTATS